MKKKILSMANRRALALLLVLVMAVGLLPATARAADTTGHKISVDIYKVVLDSSKPLGYQNPEKVQTIIVTCEDKTAHSGYNHFVSLKLFHPTAFGLPEKDWMGWEFANYYTKGQEKSTFYTWNSQQVNANANVVGNEPYQCANNFYLVYNAPAPVTEEYVLKYDKNTTDTCQNIPQEQKYTVEKGGRTTADISTLVPTREGYTFNCWSTSKESTQPSYNPGGKIELYSSSTTLYAQWIAQKYTVTYNDGVDNEVVFADQVYPNQPYGAATPAFSGTPTREGYDFLGWNPTVSATVTRDITYYANWEKKAPVAPEKPGEGGDDLSDILGADFVTVHCTNALANHADQAYGLLADSYKVGEVEETDGKFTCTVEIFSEKYIEKYNEDFDEVHTTETASETVTLTHDGESWSCAEKVTFDAACDYEPEPEVPDAPETGDLTAILGEKFVTVECTNENADHAAAKYDVFDCTIGEVKETDGKFNCTVTIAPDKYVAKYNEAFEGKEIHTTADKAAEIVLTYADETWTADKEEVKFSVVCEFEPVVEPTDPEPTDPETKEITLTYDANGGKNAPKAETVKVDADAQSHTFTVTKEKPTRSGYKFLGWAKSKTAEKAEFTAEKTIEISEDTTLFAVWTKLDPTEPTEAPPAKTGDNSFIGLWTAVMLLTMAGTSAMLLSKKKAR